MFSRRPKRQYTIFLDKSMTGPCQTWGRIRSERSTTLKDKPWPTPMPGIWRIHKAGIEVSFPHIAYRVANLKQMSIFNHTLSAVALLPGSPFGLSALALCPAFTVGSASLSFYLAKLSHPFAGSPFSVLFLAPMSGSTFWLSSLALLCGQVSGYLSGSRI